MHVQVITFNLKDLTSDEYHELCDALAPQWAAIPGLISKVWIESSKSNTYLEGLD